MQDKLLKYFEFHQLIFLQALDIFSLMYLVCIMASLMFFCEIPIGEEVYASIHKHHKPVWQFCLCLMYFTITCVTNKKFHIRPWVSQSISFVVVRTNIVLSITFFVPGTGKWHEQCPNCAKVWTTQVPYIMYLELHNSC